jgi:hypothetical protein
MDFNFPTMVNEPLIKLTYFNVSTKLTQKNFEEKLGKIFKETRAQSKYYLAHFGEKFIEVDEFTDESFYVASLDLLVECYYDPNGNVNFAYSKFSKIRFSFHADQVKN